MFDELEQLNGHNLPSKAELVPEPAALNLAASVGELFPVVVHFLLRVAAHHERDRIREIATGTAIERGKLLPIQFERDGEDAALRPRCVAGIAQLAEPARVLEYAQVKINRLFGIRVEPEKRRNAGKVFKSAHKSSLRS